MAVNNKPNPLNTIVLPNKQPINAKGNERLDDIGLASAKVAGFSATHRMTKVEGDPTRGFSQSRDVSKAFGVDDGAYRKTLGLSDGEQTEFVKKGDKTYLHSFREKLDPNLQWADPNERHHARPTISDSKFYEIKEAPPPAAKPAGAAPKSSAEKMAQFNAMGGLLLARAEATGKLSKHIIVPEAGHEREFWASVMKAEQDEDPKTGVSDLDEFCVALAAASLVKPDALYVSGDTMARAALIKAGLMAEAVRHADPRTKTFPEINAEITAAVRKAMDVNGKPTSIDDPKFMERLVTMLGPDRRIADVSSPKQVKSNKGALDARFKAIKEAKYDLSVPVWKNYPDKVGKALIDACIAKKESNPNVSITIMVDGNVADRDPAQKALLDKAEKAGIEVIPYKDDEPTQAQNGMHYKALIADTSAPARADKSVTPVCIEGGRNWGEQYLSELDSSKPHNATGWSDSDHIGTGSYALEKARTFAELKQRAIENADPNVVKAKGWKPVAKADVPTVADVDAAAAAERAKNPQAPRAKLISGVDVPGFNNEQEISKVLVATARGMGKGDTMTLMQAYFLGLPAVEDAFKVALKNGAKIKLATNGIESNDVPVLDLASRAVLVRLKDFCKANGIPESNFEIFTKKGTTMHDKVMLFEGAKGAKFALNTSWNQHGRSQVFEVEGYSFMAGADVVAQGQRAFEQIKAMSTPFPNPTLTDFEKSLLPYGPILQPIF